jgi:putative membrane protein
MISSVALPGWHAHLDAWALIGSLVAVYLVALRRHPDRGATRGQVAAFLGGAGALLLASDWPVHDIAEGYLYSAHMAQHLLMTLVAALLLVVGTPAWMAQRLLRPRWLRATVRCLARPVPGLIQFNVILVLSHWPVVVEGTIRYHPLHFVAHAVLLLSAILMWLPVASPLREVPRLRPPMQMLYLFLQTIVPTVPASFLTFGTSPLYPIYATFPRLWGIDVLADQQMAGLIMKVAAGFYLWVIIAAIFFRWYASEERGGGDVLLWHDVERELRSLDGSPQPPA